MNTYKISPVNRKSTFIKEHWVINKFDKRIQLDVTIMWRWSEFSIELSEEQKQKILNSDEVIISDYDFEILSMNDACERFVELQDENDFTDEEIKEIYKTIYINDEKIYDEDILEENGWSLEDTTTYIVGDKMIDNYE